MSDGTTATFPIGLPAGIVAGDLLLTEVLIGNSAAAITDYAAKGWWQLSAALVNTRQYAIFARLYNPADPSSVYTLTMGAQAAAATVTMAIMGHGVVAQADVQVGTMWTRPANGGSQGLIVAPGVTTPSADRLVLALTGEASNALGAYTVQTPSGFVKINERVEGPVAGQSIEWITAWAKTQATAGATGAFEVTYGATASQNGLGLQLSIPSGATPKILGTRLSAAPSHNSLTIGVHLQAGASIDAVLKDGGTEVDRVTVAIDGASGWGNAVFAGLAAGHTYSVEFEIDGEVQSASTMTPRTLPAPGVAASFVLAAGSCQFTGSNHPVWDAIRSHAPDVLAHMGDENYENPTTVSAWRTAFQTSMMAPKFRQLLAETALVWTWDNHDRIIVDDGGGGTPLNMGRTDPATNTEARKLFGSAGWASSDTFGRTYVLGRVRFIQTDNWTMKDDPDAGTATPPLTFLGAAQKQWFKDTLEAATEEVIVWFSQWTGQNNANGRWNSFPQETAELEAWIDARPAIKAKMVMIGGDSHSLQVTDGSRTLAQGQRFAGIPNYNISGFNRTSDTASGGAGWLDDRALRAPGQPEADWGGYSLITVTDDGSALTFRWDGIRVSSTGVEDVMNTQTLVFGSAPEGLRFVEVAGGVETDLVAIEKVGGSEAELIVVEVP